MARIYQTWLFIEVRSANVSIFLCILVKQKEKQWLKVDLEKKCMVDLSEYINFKLLINSKFGSRSGGSK